MDSDISSVDRRYSLQAEWTKEFRYFLMRKLPADRRLKILEVGCGTGAVIRKIRTENSERDIKIFGVDIDAKALSYAKIKSKEIYLNVNGEQLPFQSNVFDLVICHYLLLWAENPVRILKEMRRVLAPNGLCAVMAEPCYSQMTAEPSELKKLTEKQVLFLKQSGADTDIGLDLGEIFHRAGFQNTIVGKYKSAGFDPSFIEIEVKQILSDIGEKNFTIDPNTKITYSVPTYYAFAGKG